MRNNVIDLFTSSITAKNTGKKYSDMLNDLIKPFEHDFPEDFDLDDVINFAVYAWNMGCMSLMVSEKEIAQLLVSHPLPGPGGTMLQEMINLKKKKFSEFDRFIVDYYLEENQGELVLTVATQEKEAYLENMMNQPADFIPEDADFEEGYIDRYAIVLKPKQPFYDWINALNPDDPIDKMEEANIYLVNETDIYFQDWLRKKFDRFFKAELEEWHTNKKEWPQKRSFKMFREWFNVEISTMIYDFEKQPIYKEE